AWTAPAARESRRVGRAAARQQHEPRASGAVIDAVVGSMIAVVVAGHEGVAGPAPRLEDRGVEVRAGGAMDPQAQPLVVQHHVRTAVAVEVLPRDRRVALA